MKSGFYICKNDDGGYFRPPLKDLCWRNTLFSNLHETKEERLKSTHEYLHDGSGGFTEPSIKEQRLKVG